MSTKDIMNTEVRKNTRMESGHYFTEVKCQLNRHTLKQRNSATANIKIDQDELTGNRNK